MKAKINKWDLIKLKRFCRVKESRDKTKRQPTEQENIFANDITYKESIYKIDKQLIKFNIKKKKHTKNSIKNSVEDLDRHFFPKRCTDDQQIHEKMLKITNQRNANQNHKEI